MIKNFKLEFFKYTDLIKKKTLIFLLIRHRFSITNTFAADLFHSEIRYVSRQHKNLNRENLLNSFFF